MAVECPSQPSLARRDLAMVVVGLALLLAWDASGLDLRIDGWFGNASGFPWRHHWLAEGLLHEGGRRLAMLLTAGLLLGIWWPLGGVAARLPRSQRAWWLATTLACMALVPLIKHASLSSCPWDLQVFGGHAGWVSHWAWGVADGGPGHCFPSGHASAAFAFLAGYFALRAEAPGAARAWLVAVLVLGALYAGAQLVRGAHHLSHSAWTAWICWSLTAASHHAWRLRQSPSPALA
jgi:membrane-associated PAP2 superfamily phosphatase